MGKKRLLILSIVFIILACFWGCDSTKETIDIKFDANEGYFSDSTTLQTKTIYKGSELYYDMVPERTGYTFVEWRNESGHLFVNRGEYYDNQIFTAVWEPAEYTIFFDPAEGYTNGSSVEVTYKEPLVSTYTPEREGYIFEGYYTDYNGLGEKIYDSNMAPLINSYNLTENMHLYANWTVIDYIITLDVNGGDELEESTIYASFEEHVYLPTPARYGYVFDNWNTKADNSGQEYNEYINMHYEDIELFAIWTIDYNHDFIIILDTQGGDSATGSILVQYNSNLPSAPMPTKTGYDFAGYYTQGDGQGQQVYDIQMNTYYIWQEPTDGTLYAHWEPKDYVITLHSNDGDFIENNTIDTTFNEPIGLLIDPTRTGYEFVEWNDEINGEGCSINSETIYEYDIDIIIYAIWSPLSYTVYIDNQGGQGEIDSVIAEFDADMPHLQDTPDKLGYNFGGYYSKTNGQGKQYYFSNMQSVTSWDVADEATIYAYWIPIEGTDGLEYQLVNDDQEYEVTGYTGLDSNVLVPVFYNDKVVTRIGDNAFEDSNIIGITLLESIISIGDNAFTGCTDLYELQLPKSIESIGQHAFKNIECEIIFATDSVIDTISDFAFADYKGNSIEIPNSVRTIFAYAFANASCDVIFDDNSQLVELYGLAFANYEGASIDIPSTVTYIGSYAFGSSSISQLTFREGSNLAYIGDYAFSNCPNLEEIIIPNTINSFGENIFENSFMDINFAEGATINSIVARLFKNYLGSSIQLPDGITHIYTGAFEGCINLSNINLPDDLLYLGAGAFRDCESLQSIILPDAIEEIRAETFSGCASLVEVNIPSQVQRIRAGAFRDCTGLSTEIILPNTLNSIESEAFYNVSAPIVFAQDSSIDTIGHRAFSYYQGTSITIPNSVTTLSNEIFAFATSDVLFEDEINLIIIPERAFQYYSGLRVELPESVEIIGNRAFDDTTNLETVLIGSNVASIGERAFKGCSSLVELELPSSLEYIGELAFDNVFASISFASDSIISIIGNGAFNNYKGSTLVLPDSVEEIGNEAFKDNTELIEFVIPASVVSIGEDAFFNVSAEIIFAEGSIIEEIGDYAFRFYTGESIELPDGITTLGEGAFYGKHPQMAQFSPLSHIVLPDSIESIGPEAFRDLKSLIEVDLSKTIITVIEDRLFQGCNNLESVLLPEGLELIGDYAFAQTGLLSIELPDTLITIGERAFQATDLTQITIPENVESIGNSAFYYNPNLEIIIVESYDPPNLGQDVFDRVHESFKIYVPDANVNAYKQSENWDYYEEVIFSINLL